MRLAYGLEVKRKTTLAAENTTIRTGGVVLQMVDEAEPWENQIDRLLQETSAKLVLFLYDVQRSYFPHAKFLGAVLAIGLLSKTFWGNFRTLPTKIPSHKWTGHRKLRTKPANNFSNLQTMCKTNIRIYHYQIQCHWPSSETQGMGQGAPKDREWNRANLLYLHVKWSHRAIL